MSQILWNYPPDFAASKSDSFFCAKLIYKTGDAITNESVMDEDVELAKKKREVWEINTSPWILELN